MEERALGWDDTIEKDPGEFVLLPEGEYDFEVASFERARFDGSEKLPPCNMAVLFLKVKSGEKETTIRNALFLHSKTEGLLSAFFTSIGQKKKGEPLKMNWNKVVGAKGRCKVKVRTWKNDKGEEMQSNEIARFLMPSNKTYSDGKF